MTLLAILGVISSAIYSGTSLLYATLGEVIGERSGIVNLGLEGVLLVSAATGVSVASQTGNPYLGILAAMFAGGLVNIMFGYLVISRKANQLASGLATMFFGFGLSALIGKDIVGAKIASLPRLLLPGLSGLPRLYTSLFKFDFLIFLVLPMALLVWWALFRTRWGLGLRATGESTDTAFASGRDPRLIRYQALFVGLGYFFWGRLQKVGRMFKFSHASDWLFIIMLFLTTLTGILLHLFRIYGMPAATYYMYITHMAVLVPMLVIEVPFEDRLDVLAVYADGTARYINHQGGMIVWGFSRDSSTIRSRICPSDSRPATPERSGPMVPWNRSSGMGILWQRRQLPSSRFTTASRPRCGSPGRPVRDRGIVSPSTAKGRRLSAHAPETPQTKAIAANHQMPRSRPFITRATPPSIRTPRR